MRVLAVVLGASLVVAGCKSGPAEPGDGGTWTASAASAGSPATPRAITRAECTAWSAHAVEVLVSDWKASASECSGAERAALASHLDDQVVSIRTGAETLCASHVGETFTPREAKCFTDATSYAAMKACSFGPMTNPGDSDMLAVFAQQRETCRKGAAKGPSSGSTAL